MGGCRRRLGGLRRGARGTRHEARGAGQKEARTGTVRQPAGEDAYPTVLGREGQQSCHYDLHNAQTLAGDPGQRLSRVQKKWEKAKVIISC